MVRNFLTVLLARFSEGHRRRARTMASRFETSTVKPLVPLAIEARLSGDVIKAVARDVLGIIGEKE